MTAVYMARGVRIMDFVAFTRLDQFLINIICRGCIIIKRLDMTYNMINPRERTFFFKNTQFSVGPRSKHVVLILSYNSLNIQELFQASWISVNKNVNKL